MTCPELRITDAEVALTRRWPTCRACAGELDCPRCDWGLDPEGYGIRLGRGASARIGAAIVAHLPHLRHAVWPPRRQRVDGSTLATAIGLALGVGGGR